MNHSLNSAIIEIESRFNVKTGIWSAISQTGEGYVVICSHGEKPEGEPMPYYPTPDDAVDRWLVAVNRYAEGRAGTLYWRAMPSMKEVEIKELNSSPYKAYAVYSRLLISSLPVTHRHEGDEIVNIAA